MPVVIAYIFHAIGFACFLPQVVERRSCCGLCTARAAALGRECCVLSWKKSEMNPFCFLNAEMFVEVVRQRAGSSLLLDLKKCIDPSVVTNRCLSAGLALYKTQVKYSDTKL